MKKTFLIAAAIAALPYAASALIDATDANLGQSCWSDGDGVGYKLIKCNTNNISAVDMWAQTCGRTYAETQSDRTFIASGASSNGSSYGFGPQGLHCIAWTITNNEFYMCSMEAGISNTPACSEAVEAARNEYPQVEKVFVKDGSRNRTYFLQYQCSSTQSMAMGDYQYDLSCSEIREYGCPAGWYHSDGEQYSNSYTCTQCPTPGTSWGNEETGDITSCYIAAGTTFSDSTGSGTYKYDCYYKK